MSLATVSDLGLVVMLSSMVGWGLQSKDLNTVAKILLTSMGGFPAIPERNAQGVLNQLMIMRVLRKSNMWEDARVFKINNRTVVTTEVNKADGNRVEIRDRIYSGFSLGSILGTVYMALSPDVKAATLSVPGGPFSLLFPRNDAGSLIITKLIAVHFSNSGDRMIMLFLMHHMWELCDPTGYSDALEAGGILGDNPGEIDITSRGLGKKKILIQIGITDTTVNGIAAGYLIRSLGGAAFYGNAYEPSFMLKNDVAVRTDIQRKSSDVVDPYTGFKVIQKGDTPHIVVNSFHFQKTPAVIPFFNYPPTLPQARFYDTHELIRLLPTAIRQFVDFMHVYLQTQHRGTPNDDSLWVRDICGSRGCWQMVRPNRNQLRWIRPR